MHYFFGLGSNIAPHQHMPRMVQALLELAPVVHVGRIVATAPVGVMGDPFLNTVVALEYASAPATVKLICNALETAFGRDRGAPGSKTKSRTADIDPLFALTPDQRHVPAALIPSEPYTRPMLLELLVALGHHTEIALPAPDVGVAVALHGLTIGRSPISVRRDGGQYRYTPTSW
jgi:2-amino-4-hydroxy-6-hydroxymethyldihydropteridine diphosphokinase